jgi:hypothetical protein
MTPCQIEFTDVSEEIGTYIFEVCVGQTSGIAQNLKVNVPISTETWIT